MSDQIKIGNVSFYKNDVKNSIVTYKNGEKINCVWLNNGTKIEFKDQNTDNRAEVVTGYYAGNTRPGHEYGTGFSNIKGLHIEGSNNDDFYHISNCDDYNVNVTNGGEDRVRIFESDGKTKGNIKADQNDNVEYVNGTGFINMNEGFFIRPNDTDVRPC